MGAGNEWLGERVARRTSGFGDATVPYYNFMYGVNGAASYTSPGNSLPPAHWTNCVVSGGVATLPTRTLTAEGDYTSQSTRPPFGGQTAAFIDSYQVTIHATPYNFQRVSVRVAHILTSRLSKSMRT